MTTCQPEPGYPPPAFKRIPGLVWMPGDPVTDVSRTIAYSWGPRANGLASHEEATRLLQRAQRDGVVSQWFTGKPGPKLRALRRELWRLWVMDGR